MGMPLDAFTEVAWKGLISGSDQIIVDNPNIPMETFNSIVDNRRNIFSGLTKMLRGGKD